VRISVNSVVTENTACTIICQGAGDVPMDSVLVARCSSLVSDLVRSLAETWSARWLLLAKKVCPVIFGVRGGNHSQFRIQPKMLIPIDNGRFCLALVESLRRKLSDLGGITNNYLTCPPGAATLTSSRLYPEASGALCIYLRPRSQPRKLSIFGDL